MIRVDSAGQSALPAGLKIPPAEMKELYEAALRNDWEPLRKFVEKHRRDSIEDRDLIDRDLVALANHAEAERLNAVRAVKAFNAIGDPKALLLLAASQVRPKPRPPAPSVSGA
jgi:hypothetical protein